MNQDRRLLDATSYTVRSWVPVAIFERFVNSLKTDTTIPVPQGNPVSL
jgi:hypothetical protein